MINDTHLVDEQGFYKKKKAGFKEKGLPYPNPIKFERKEEKGNYLSAEMMRLGISLQMTDIRPDTNIESEIFPKELTRKGGNDKDVFTPPNHKQMKFAPDDDNA